MKPLLASVLALAVAVAPLELSAANPHKRDPHNLIQRVLLLSVDGMHSLDFINCANGMPGVNGGAPYCPNLAALGVTGTTYLNASTSRPSDSFPGLMAIVTGGSPRSVGAFYDVAYDRSLAPPKKTTGNGVAGGPCGVSFGSSGTTTEFDEGIDIDQTQLNGGAPSGDGGVNSIDPDRLERDPKQGCAPVWPWNFVRTNTIFGVIHAAGGYTAWSDKHPSYSSVNGPGNGTNVDDYYSPEINSTVIALPGVVTPLGTQCSPIPDPSQTGAWTDSFQNIQCYDTLKVNAILNEIDGKTHNGQNNAPVPTVFGMNFQAVSLGEKLIEHNVGTGGYVDAAGTPSSFLLNEIQFVDAAVGQWVSELRNKGLLDTTLIVITAKHGQSPIDPNRFYPIPGHNGNNGTSPANLIASLLPWSESPLNQSGIGPTEDDVSLLWLTSSTQTQNAVSILEQNAQQAGLGEIFYGPSITTMFNAPGIPPAGDPRTPDIIVTPNYGVVYTSSSKKLAEHGGFSHDDRNVIMLLSNPSFQQSTVNTPVETMQVAPTVLRALGLNPNALQSVQIEGTAVLPATQF
jgi:Type I phosphodiesterase / nucleotide pyrophosphatase